MAGLTEGGALYVNGPVGNFTQDQFSTNVAQAGTGGTGGVGGMGGMGATGGPPGNGGVGGIGGIGGLAFGGGLANLQQGAFTISGSTFNGNQTLSGGGGAGGAGGSEGNIGTGNLGGTGGVGGAGVTAGIAEGGGVFDDQGGNLVVSGSSFLGNQVTSGAGGAGGAGGTGAPGGGDVGNGGRGGAGGNSSIALGGAIALVTGNLTVSSSVFGGPNSGNGNTVTGGAGGVGGIGGTGFTAGSGGTGGNGGAGYGGAISLNPIATTDIVGNVSITTSTFTADAVTSGAGGAGGSTGLTLARNAGGAGGTGGVAYGGAVSYYIPALNSDTTTNSISITSSAFSNDGVTSGAGGAGGVGNSGIGGPASDSRGGGLAIVDAVGATSVTLTSSTFTTNGVAGGVGGGGSSGGNGASAFGGAIDLLETTTLGGTATLTSDLLTGNVATGGTGGTGSSGNGGAGGAVFGGALGSLNYNVISLSFSPADLNAATSGAGGAGGGAGGAGGNAGVADGGGLALAQNLVPNSGGVSFTITSSDASNNTLIQSAAGLAGSAVSGSGGMGGTGGAAGSVSLDPPSGLHGAGVSINLLQAAAGAPNVVTITGSHFDNNRGTAGTGGGGGLGGGAGGNAGAGGEALGGGLFFNNSSGNTVAFTFSNSTASNDTITAGSGGIGGNSGPGGGSEFVPSGIGGDGGEALGGGLYLGANSISVNTSSVTNAQFDYNVLNSGQGGDGGAGGKGTSGVNGTLGEGGAGGMAAGGGLYNSSSNANTTGTLNLFASTLAGNQVTAGTVTGVGTGIIIISGGNGGTGSTTNGGLGGNGGNAGNAFGGGLFGGNNTLLTVMNTTIGGTSVNTLTPDVNRNIVIAGNGGRGGDAGVTGMAVPLTDVQGGNGGNGGSESGGGVYLGNSTATFTNDTIVANEVAVSLNFGAGGTGGREAGSSDTTKFNGSNGANGIANGGGIYSDSFGAGNFAIAFVGNNIIDLNIKSDTTNTTSPPVTTNPDIYAAGPNSFASQGNNILGSNNSTVGFTGSDSFNVGAGALNIGPLLANGGSILTNSPGPQANSPIDSPTPILTDALLKNSVAIDTGNNALVSGSDSFDERGAGFPRIFPAAGTVDVGAYEFEIPSIVSFNPSSVTEGTPSFTLAISGVDYVQGQATVTVMGASSATWAPLTSVLPILSNTTGAPNDTITVNVPVVYREQDGPLTFTIAVPDGSGIPGQTLTASDTFAINPPTSLSISYGSSVTYVAGATVTLSPIDDGDPNIQQWDAHGTLPNGLSINNLNGTITGTIADSDSFGTYPITVTAIDDGFQDTITFNMTVLGPTITSLNPPQLPEGNGAFNLLINGGDFDTQGTATVTVLGASSATWAPSSTTPLNILSLSDSSITVSVPATVIEQDGPLVFTVTVPDGSGIQGHTLTASATFIITQPPSVTITYPGSPFTNLAGGTVSQSPNITDPNVQQWNATGLPGGLSINTTNGAITGTILDSDSFGAYNVSVTAINDGVTDSGSFTWNVAGPQITSIVPNTRGEGSASFSLTINGTNLENNGTAVVTVYGSASATWAPTTTLPITSLSNTQITVNVPALYLEQDGPVPFTVSIPDASGVAGHTLTSNSVTLNITPPTSLNFQYASQNTQEGQPVNVSSNNMDPNVNNWTISGQPPGLTINSANGDITGAPNLGSVGEYTVTVGATDDGFSSSTTFMWTVTGPTITSLNPTSEPEGSGSFTLTITGTDFQNAGAATVSISGTNLTPTVFNDSSMTVNVPGSLLQQDGPLFVSVSVPDGSGIPGHTLTSGSATFTITPPASLTFTYPNQDTIRGTTVSVSSSNTDPNVNNWQATNLPAGLNINNSNGVISGTITATPATYTVTVTAVDDGTHGSDTFTWTVEPPNVAPSFSITPSTTASEDGGPNAISYSDSSFTTNIIPGPSNEYNQVVHFNIIGDSSPSLFSVAPTITINGAAPNYPLTGTLTYTIAPNVTSGSATVTVTLQDNGGTVGGGQDTSTAQTFVITVAPVNQPPTFTIPVPSTTASIDDGNNSVAYSDSSFTTNISQGAPYESWQTVSFVVTGDSNASLFSVAPAIDSNGTLTYSTAPFANGTATITVEAVDNGGTANGGNNTSTPKTFTINVTPVNQAPSFTVIGTGDQAPLQSAKPTLQSVAWATNIMPGPASESGQTVHFNVIGDSNSSLFSVAPTISPNGTLTYQLAPLVVGTAQITVDLQNDGGTANGGQDTSPPATFSITVTPVTQPPSFTLAGSSYPATVDGGGSAGPLQRSGLGDQYLGGAAQPGRRAAHVQCDEQQSGPVHQQRTTGHLVQWHADVHHGPVRSGSHHRHGDAEQHRQHRQRRPADTPRLRRSSSTSRPSIKRRASPPAPIRRRRCTPGLQTVPNWATNIASGPPSQSGEAVTFLVSNNNPGLFSVQPSVDANGTLTYESATTAGTAVVTVTLMNNGGTANGGQNTSAPVHVHHHHHPGDHVRIGRRGVAGANVPRSAAPRGSPR